MSKYGNKKTWVGDIKFDSKREAARYCVLKEMEDKGEIRDLKLQLPFLLIPKQGKERAVKYIADFVYRDENGSQVVEDVKGVKTDVYKIKRKLMMMVHGIKIEEV